jgi:hypothetical protein
MAEVGCLKDGHFQNMSCEGKLLLGGVGVDHEVVGNTVCNGTFAVTGLTTLTGGLTDLAPTFSVVTASTLTAAAGNEYMINRAGGVAITLPQVTAGAVIIFNVGITATSDHVITATTGDLMSGYAFIEDNDNAADNGKSYFAPVSSFLIMTLNGSTTGGLIGDQITLVGISATEWRVRAVLKGTGVIATPFT